MTSAKRTAPLVWIGICLAGACLVGMIPLDLYLIRALVFPQANSARPLPYDCLALMEDRSVVAFLNTTHTAYRSHDGGITWRMDPAIGSMTHCSGGWPATVGTQPPITFYFMQDLGLYQSLDGGETLTFVPIDLGETKYVSQAVVTQFDTLILSIGGGELFLRLPDGEWIRYREKSHELLPESEPE